VLCQAKGVKKKGFKLIEGGNKKFNSLGMGPKNLGEKYSEIFRPRAHHITTPL